jgi:hypothetical protein
MAELGGFEGKDETADFLRLDDDDIDAATTAAPLDDHDSFVSQLSIPNTPIVVDRIMLQNLTLAEVLVRRWPNPNIPAQYFRVMDPRVDIVVGPCGHFFEASEFEMVSMTQGSRPFSREGIVQSDVVDEI